MENILQELQGKKCWKSFLKSQCRKNKISPQLVASFTLIKFRKFHEKLSHMQPLSKPRQESNKERTKSSVWLENELKAYQWFLVAFTACKGISIERCGQDEWKFLSTIFCKEENVLEYEAIKLAKQRSMAKRPWQSEQTAMLQEIIREQASNKWNEMARRLFSQSNRRFFRSGKQCRERWLNHLDPDKKHGHWECTEDRKIATCILQKGPRWSEIARSLGGHRTQHMVKNRVKTLLIKLRKKYGEANSEDKLLQKFIKDTEQMTDLYNSSDQIGKTSLQVQGLPVHSYASIESQKKSLDNQQYNDFLVYDLPEQDFHQPGTPNHITVHPYTPNFINTPNSLTFLMNYSFDHYEHQHLFLKNN